MGKVKSEGGEARRKAVVACWGADGGGPVAGALGVSVFNMVNRFLDDEHQLTGSEI
jgi:hypothetical protein